jgi:surface carbohydrate biosynthesis protein
MKNNIIIIFILLKSIFILKNWVKPTTKKVIVYDFNLSNFLFKYLDKTKIFVLHNRIDSKLDINFYILLKLFFLVKFSHSEYKKLLIKYINPKFIVTFIDNNPGYYNLKKDFPKIKIIIIQSALRYGTVDFDKKLKNLKKNNKVDYTFVMNSRAATIYKNFLTSTFIKIGSFRSNYYKILKCNKKKYDFLYIAKGAQMFRSKKIKLFETFDFEDYFGKEKILLKNLLIFLKSKNIKLSLLGQSNKKNDKLFYDNLLGESNYNYIENYNGRPTYEILDSANIVAGVSSTLLFESLSRMNKTIFFSSIRREDFFGSNDFHNICNLPKKGKFWTDSYAVNEIKRIFDFLQKIDTDSWKNLVINNRYNKGMIYCNNNKKILKYFKKWNFPIISNTF